MTADEQIGLDGTAFFQNMLVGNLEGTYRHLLVAPAGIGLYVVLQLGVEDPQQLLPHLPVIDGTGDLHPAVQVAGHEIRRGDVQLVAPAGIKPRLLELIDREIAKGPEGRIRIKANSMTEREPCTPPPRRSPCTPTPPAAGTRRCCLPRQTGLATP